MVRERLYFSFQLKWSKRQTTFGKTITSFKGADRVFKSLFRYSNPPWSIVFGSEGPRFESRENLLHLLLQNYSTDQSNGKSHDYLLK